jgi:hypothetical protein
MVQLLVYAEDVNILGGSIHTIKKNRHFIGLEVNAEKTKYMVSLVNRMRDKITT